MKSVIHRAYDALRRRKHGPPDVESATPLVQLLDEAEPAPHMFSRIEARIDAEPPHPGSMRYRFVVLAFFLGLSACALTVFVARDSLGIAVRSAADTRWVPLGSVTLHGSALRKFVRAKCLGHTHVLITLHGYSPALSTDTEAHDTLLITPEGKILMACIF